MWRFLISEAIFLIGCSCLIMLTKERKVGGEGEDKVDQGLVGDRPASLHVEDNQVERWEEVEAEKHEQRQGAGLP